MAQSLVQFLHFWEMLFYHVQNQSNCWEVLTGPLYNSNNLLYAACWLIICNADMKKSLLSAKFIHKKQSFVIWGEECYRGRKLGGVFEKRENSGGRTTSHCVSGCNSWFLGGHALTIITFKLERSQASSINRFKCKQFVYIHIVFNNKAFHICVTCMNLKSNEHEIEI